ncbi:MAG TPA: sulfotransferase [Terriglobales bacterium]|nr:sulfotransferase [Terriglobales bacterium]
MPERCGAEQANTKHVFVVGCPRSGTTWLHLLLAQHSQVATTRETHLFDGYLARLDQTWQSYKSRQATVGLTLLLSEQEFYDLCRNFAMEALQKLAARNEGATVILEKTPQHVRYAPLILKLIPGAYFIHIVRDPRSVVSSLRAAAQDWGRSWAFSGVRNNSELWHSEVSAGHQISELTPNFRELRFEDLKGERAPEILKDLFTWLGLPADAQFIDNALEACRIDNVREGGQGIRSYGDLKPRDPDSLRKGVVDSWKDELSSRQIRIIEYINSDLMKAFGYESALMKNGSAKPFRLVLAELFDRVDWRARTSLEKLRNSL